MPSYVWDDEVRERERERKERRQIPHYIIYLTVCHEGDDINTNTMEIFMYVNEKKIPKENKSKVE